MSIQAVTSVGALSVDGKEYWQVKNYKHYTKEEDGNIVEIIDVTFCRFYEGLTKIKPGSVLKYYARVYESAKWEFNEAHPVGEIGEEYEIKGVQFFVNRAELHQTGEITYRFYISEMKYSNYDDHCFDRKDDKKQPSFDIRCL